MKKFLLKFLQFFLGNLSILVLKKYSPQIIGVTGSVGKTSTKEAIYTVLKRKFKKWVRKSEGNLNNELGVPLAILGFKKSPSAFLWPAVLVIFLIRALYLRLSSSFFPKILVLEMAADKPGDIKYLTSFARPKIGIITNVGPSHLEFFGTIKRVGEEKANIVRALSLDGTAILNADDDFCSKIGVSFLGKKLTFGIKRGADIKAENIHFDLEKESLSFNLIYQDKNVPVTLPVLGEHFVYTALAAAGVGIVFGMDLGEISTALKNFKTIEGRAKLISGLNQTKILDDSYNANPLSMEAALDMLKNLGGGRKIAVLGEMMELGDYTKQAHQDLGKKAKEGIDLVIGIGKRAKLISPNQWFSNSKQGGEFLLKEIKKGDIILIKGSRAVEMEKIVEKIKI